MSGFLYSPQGPGPFPAILVLHTRGGLSLHERSVASLLADQGYVALAPDYLSPEGITAENFDLSSTLTQHVDRIRDYLGRGVECLKSLPYVDPASIGAMGFSLGGYFCLLMAARNDVRAVVSYYGAYHGSPVSMRATRYPFSEIAAQVKAPVLMFHGDTDNEVGLTLASSAHRLLRSSGKQADLVIYPGVGHRFDRTGSPTYNAQAAADAISRALAFLGEVLR